MYKTKVLSGQACQDALLLGVDTLANAVGSTLGPRSGLVGMSRTTQQGEVYDRVINKDGVSVGRAIDLQDEAINFSAQILLEAAQKTVQSVGDGTTAVTILAQALYHQGRKRIAAGISPMSIKEQIEPDLKTALQILEMHATPVTTLKQKIQVATISCEEESLGKLIGETIDSVGSEGVVTVENSKSGETRLDFQEGMQWDRGFASPYFMTDPETRMGAIENGYIFVTDFSLTNILDIKPLLDEFITHSRFLTIVAPEFGGDALTSLIANKMQNVFLTLCVKAPSFGRQQTDMLQDIAILTNATFITKEQGHKLTDVRFEHLGKAQKVTADRISTLISGGEGKKEAIQARIDQVKMLIEEETNDFELQRLRERLAKLTKGVAVIRVGGATDVEIKERYERALDATLATRQAVKKGIIAGGETAYLTLIPHMQSTIVQEALKAPFQRLCTNAGLDSGQMLERLESKSDGYGINVITGKPTRMIKEGIIDPVAVPLEVLKNAFSVALQLLATTSIVIPEVMEKK